MDNRFRTSTTISERLGDKGKAMRGLIEELILHIKAFDGDIYGGVLRDYKSSGIPYIKDINCRIDNIVLYVFINILQLHFEVKELTTPFSNYFVDYSKKLQVYPKHDSSVYAILDIVTLSRSEWMRLPCDFDVNVLAENSISSFIRSNYVSMNKFVDKYGHVQKRIREGQFALLEPCSQKSADEVKQLIDRGTRLLSRQWIMDDSIQGKDSWIVNYWIMMTTAGVFVRSSFDTKQVEMLKAQCECSLCGEAFQPNDVVLNTKCNHNFHWSNDAVEGKSCKGLREWMRLGNSSCPICRKNVH
jgi:hypothetical protein